MSAETTRLRETIIKLVAALQIIAEQCEDHPAYLWPNATEAELHEEGGDAATITHWAQIARAALAKVSA